MVIKPRIRGFICTTAHPLGCAAGVKAQKDYVVQSGDHADGPKKVLVLGCSGGYGLASRIVAGFGYGAATLGVSFEKPPSEKKTATAGWYNNLAFEELAAAAGLYAKTFDGDAFSDAMKDQVIEVLKEDLGKIDLLVYSLASPLRKHPRTGELQRSVIKPLGETIHVQTLNVARGEVYEVDLEPANEAETRATVAVMGGEDWEFWIHALKQADLLAPGFQTTAYTYIGSDLTWPIYWQATLGKAKEDLDRAARSISVLLQGLKGQARVAVLKAVVTQASSAIPVVPLYVSLLFRVMKQQGVHEQIIEHIDRLFRTQLYSSEPRLDDQGRLRVDNLELAQDIQAEVKRLWHEVSTENIEDISDLAGYRSDFLKIFGFGFEGVDYAADVDPKQVKLLTGD